VVDWITVVAQVVNFLILAALLRRFLYRPIVATMAARQDHIDRQLQEARHLKAQAERLILTYRQKLESLEAERRKLLERARREAETEHQALLEKARLEVEEKRRAWQADLAREQAQLLRDLETLLAEQLVALGRRALSDLAGRRLEDCVVETFLERMASLPADQRRLLAEARDPEWTVATALALDETLRRRIETELRRLNTGARIRFQQRDELILGITLETDGRLWPWSLTAWLEELEAELRRVLQVRS